MAKWSLLRTTSGTSGGTGGTGGTGSSVPSVQAVTCSGFMDATTGAVTLTVSVVPPSPVGSFVGCHLFLELPDQSANASQVVGSTTVGGSAAVTGPWAALDLGEYTYVDQQSWTIHSPGAFGINSTLDFACRLYAVSYSNDSENSLVRANQSGASPNVAFTLVSTASGTPTSGTNVTAVSGAIAASALTADNSTGKLKTPVIVVVSSVPPNIANWCYRLVLTYGNSDATVISNQFVMTPLQTDAGPVISPADGITTPHSFVIDTPAAITQATVWCQSGLNDGGNFRPNNIVPGITPSFPLSFGTTGGTIDLGKAKVGSFDGSTLVANLGVMTVGVIGSANIGFAQIQTAHIGALQVTDSLIAPGVSAAKITTGTLQVGGVGGTNPPFLTVLDTGGTQIGWIGQTGGNSGAWFKTMRVGGSGYSSAPLQADSSGNVSLSNADISWPNQAVGPNYLGCTISAGQIFCAKYNAAPPSGLPTQNVQIDGTGVYVAQGSFVASLTPTTLYVPLTITAGNSVSASSISANSIILKAGNLSSNNTGVPMNYGSGMMFTGTLAGVSGSLASYGNAINVYDANGSYLGRIPLI